MITSAALKCNQLEISNWDVSLTPRHTRSIRKFLHTHSFEAIKAIVAVAVAVALSSPFCETRSSDFLPFFLYVLSDEWWGMHGAYRAIYVHLIDLHQWEWRWRWWRRCRQWHQSGYMQYRWQQTTDLIATASLLLNCPFGWLSRLNAVELNRTAFSFHLD